MVPYTLHTLGARGSRPSPGPLFSEFGSETSCYLLKGADYALIVDCGTGLYGVHALLKDCRQVDVVFTHLHYDHLLGLLDFGAFPSEANVTYYGAFTRWLGSEKLTNFFQPPFWPAVPNHKYVNVDVNQAVSVHRDVSFTVHPGSHPDEGCFVSVEVLGRKLCFCFDFEYKDSSCDVLLDVAIKNGCDLLIFDGMYSQEEYEMKRGWGHSTRDDGIMLAKRYQVGYLYFTHHDPTHTDSILCQREREAREWIPNTSYARIGDVIDVTDQGIVFEDQRYRGGT